MKGVRLYQARKAVVGSYPEPRITRDDEIKVRVHYCSINSDDYAMYTDQIKSRLKSNGILSEFSGVIAALGEQSRLAGFSEGDPVSATLYYPCGTCPMCRRNRPDLCIEMNWQPALNEYIVLNSRTAVHLPKQLPLRHGVLFWLAARCMQGVERLNIQPGDTVLIHGAGNVGLMMLQMVLSRMPRLVVVSDPIPDNRVLALQFGAHVVWNPYHDSIAAETLRLTNGFGFDHIVDAAGSLEIMPYTVNLLSRGGKLLLFSNYPPGNTLSLDLADIYWKEYTITSAYNITYAPYTANADFMLHLNLEPLIGVEYPIEEINEAFHAYATHRYQKILIHI